MLQTLGEWITKDKGKIFKKPNHILCTKSHMKCNNLGMLNLKIPKRYNMQTLSQETWNDYINIRQSKFQSKKFTRDKNNII